MRPFVVINVAATVDGKIDTHQRLGAPISSERDRQRVDALRASVDAVMVGGRTLHDEDPRLTVRSAALRAERVTRGQPENPARVGIATRVRLRPDARFVSGADARIILFVARGGASQSGYPGVEVYELGEGRVDLAQALETLGDIGMRRVLVEGGGSLNFEMLRLGLVDELQVYIAPLIFGGATAPTLADGEGLARDMAIRLRRDSIESWEDGGVLVRYMVEPT
ncbi:MAG TPA: dihydrofolate reductase family protein [Chloroflexota bacterium]